MLRPSDGWTMFCISALLVLWEKVNFAGSFEWVMQKCITTVSGKKSDAVTSKVMYDKPFQIDEDMTDMDFATMCPCKCCHGGADGDVTRGVSYLVPIIAASESCSLLLYVPFDVLSVHSPLASLLTKQSFGLQNHSVHKDVGGDVEMEAQGGDLAGAGLIEPTNDGA